MSLQPINNEYFIRVDTDGTHWASSTAECIAVVADELLEYIKTATEKLQQTSKEMTRLYQEGGSINMHENRGVLISSAERFQRDARLKIYRTDSLHADTIRRSQELDRDLTVCLHANLSFMEKHAGKELVEGDKFATVDTGWWRTHEDRWHVEPDWSRPDRASSHSSYVRFSLMDGIRCPNCNMAVVRADLSKHQIHPICNITKDTKDAINRGLTKTDFDLGMICREAGIETAMVAVKYDIHIPAWVEDAIRLYNLQGQDYAGMSLVEYLARMKPTPPAPAVQQEPQEAPPNAV